MLDKDRCCTEKNLQLFTDCFERLAVFGGGFHVRYSALCSCFVQITSLRLKDDFTKTYAQIKELWMDCSRPRLNVAKKVWGKPRKYGLPKNAKNPATRLLSSNVYSEEWVIHICARNPKSLARYE